MPPSKNKKQTGHARYTIQIPTHDTLGQPLLDLSLNAHSRLTKNLGRLVHSIHVEGPYSHGASTHRHLNVVAHDTPEVDSHIKSLATELAFAANHPYVSVIKESQQGIQPWAMQNKRFDYRVPAIGLAPQPVPLPSGMPLVSAAGVLSSSKVRRWLRADKSLPKL